ncbi:MAG: hypothetical protein U0324_23550 [Polyangiales bacterium]
MDHAPHLVRSPLRFNCPCSDDRAAALVARLRRPGARLADLGCGWGELLLDLAEASEGARGVGVERRSLYVSRARLRAVGRHLEPRVSFIEGDAARYDGPADVLLAVGASGALGGYPLFEKLAARMAPGASMLFAEAVWEAGASAELRASMGELPSADDVAREAERAGLRAVHHARSTLAEWDAFEAGWRAPFEQSDEPAARAYAAERRARYEEGYRGKMGFGWWVFAAA